MGTILLMLREGAVSLLRTCHSTSNTRAICVESVPVARPNQRTGSTWQEPNVVAGNARTRDPNSIAQQRIIRVHLRALTSPRLLAEVKHLPLGDEPLAQAGVVQALHRHAFPR